ncbi:MAG: tetratricopeptide repeat protein, partial [Candidatus Sulfotelmatobacter sp.]
MRQFCPNRFHESAFPFGLSSATVAIFMVLASALTVAAAQTATSHAAEIHDHLRKAAEYLNAKDPDSAVKEFDTVLALDPKNAEAYANLGVVAFFRRDYRSASEYLRKAVAIDPS